MVTIDSISELCYPNAFLQFGHISPYYSGVALCSHKKVPILVLDVLLSHTS